MDRWDHEDEDEAAIDEVCVCLGRPRQWLADDGFEHTIVGGAVDGPRVAWVERRCRDDGGWVDVEFCLRVRIAGALVRVWCVETYNPYFGCEVGLVRIGAEAVTLVYGEKHRTLLAVVPWVGAVQLRAIDRRWRVEGERVLWQCDEARGLVAWAWSSGVMDGLPLPLGCLDAAPVWSRAWPVEDVAAMQAAIVRRLWGERPPEPLAGLLVGALAWPYWAPAVPVVECYDALPGRLGEHNDPHWLPWYWQQSLAGAEAEAVLAGLERIAGREATAPGEDVQGWRVELACRHVAERCVELVAACRTGRLPAGEWCHFWASWSQAGFAAGPRGRFPEGLWQVWASLRPHAEALARRGA